MGLTNRGTINNHLIDPLTFGGNCGIFQYTSKGDIQYMKRSSELIILILAILLTVPYFAYLVKEQKECESKGGVMIRSYSYTCVKGLEKVK